jgi:tripeptide aminopeptidase
MENIITRILDLAIQIQQIPAPTFHEQERADFVRACFEKENLMEVTTDSIGNVYARLAGRGERPPLILSAHTDTVFPLSTPLTVTRTPDKIHAPGIGDNSLAVAGLFGLLWNLRTLNLTLPGDLWLVANTSEEGLGDLVGMRAVVERYGSQALAYLILEGMALGKVYHRALGVRRYRMTARTQGGHSWADFGRTSAIHELARLITQLTNIQLPQKPRTSLNVGVIQGGTSINTIAPEATLEIDLRSEDPQTLETLVGQVQALVEQANQPGQVQFFSEMIGKRPAGEISSDHLLVRIASDCLKEQGLQPKLNIGSTDANIPLSQGLPAVCIGLTTGGGAHTIEEYIDLPPLKKGLAQLTTLIQRAFQEL